MWLHIITLSTQLAEVKNPLVEVRSCTVQALTSTHAGHSFRDHRRAYPVFTVITAGSSSSVTLMVTVMLSVAPNGSVAVTTTV